MRQVIGSILIILLAISLSGCIDVDTSPSSPGPGVTMKGSSRYSVGDIVGQEPGEDTGSLILSYSQDSDIYTTQQVYYEKYYNNGQWVFYEWKPQTYRREFEESYDPYLLAHVDPKSIEKYDFSQPL